MLVAKAAYVGIDLLTHFDRLDDPLFLALAQESIDAGFEILEEVNREQ